jgi:Oxidoreductase-like protein, N-terminal
MAIVKQVVSSWKCPACLNRFPLCTLRPGRRSNNRSRGYHASQGHLKATERPTQARPLSGYYAELLSPPASTQLPSNPPSPSSSTSTSTTHPSTARKQSTEERARVIFGSRLAGSGYERRSSDAPDATWRTINGIPIPPRPAEPDNCCMSGCVHCVWDDYRDEVEGWAIRLQQAQARGRGDNSESGQGISLNLSAQRSEVANASTSMDEDGGGSETNWHSGDIGDLFSSIPVGIREFMRTEKRLKARHRGAKQRGQASTPNTLT